MLIWNEGRGHKLMAAPYLCLKFRRSATSIDERDAANYDASDEAASRIVAGGGDEDVAMPAHSVRSDDRRECGIYADEVTAADEGEATRSVCTKRREPRAREANNSGAHFRAQITRSLHTREAACTARKLHSIFAQSFWGQLRLYGTEFGKIC